VCATHDLNLSVNPRSQKEEVLPASELAQLQSLAVPRREANRANSAPQLRLAPKSSILICLTQKEKERNGLVFLSGSGNSTLCIPKKEGGGS
jgi:hypothetical protein